MKRNICRDARYMVLSAFFIFMLVLQPVFLAGCSSQETTAEAVYLVPESGGQLKDLEKHPEILVVHTISELKKAVKNAPDLSIWIDKDAADQFDPVWYQEEPRNFQPLVLVGYNNALYSFRETLSLPTIEGPLVDWDLKSLEPGFSIWILQERTDSSEKAYMKGYDTVPTAEAILTAEKALLQDSERSNDQ